MKLLDLVALTIVALIACKESANKSSPTAQNLKLPAATQPSAPFSSQQPNVQPATTSKPSAPKLPATLALANAKLSIGKKGGEIRLSESGDLNVNNKLIGKITSDGKLVVDGEVVLAMAEDGTVELDPSIAKTVEISKEGNITVDGDPFVEIDDNGTVWEHKKNKPKEQITTIDGPPEARRTIAFLLVASMLSRSQQTPPPTPQAGRSPETAPVPAGPR